MLKDASSSAIVAVRDIGTARTFYGDTLDLGLVEDGDVLVYATGATKLVVYASEFAGTNRANAVVWGVGEDFENVVADLSARGVAFEKYPDMEGVEERGDFYVAGDFRMAWFKDPDGNVLHINSGD